MALTKHFGHSAGPVGNDDSKTRDASLGDKAAIDHPRQGWCIDISTAQDSAYPWSDMSQKIAQKLHLRFALQLGQGISNDCSHASCATTLSHCFFFFKQTKNGNRNLK